MRRIAVFAVLAISQWAPWILVAVMPPPLAGAVGAAVFALVLWWAVRLTPSERRSSWGLSPRRPAMRLAGAGFLAGGLTYLAVFGLRWWIGHGDSAG